MAPRKSKKSASVDNARPTKPLPRRAKETVTDLKMNIPATSRKSAKAPERPTQPLPSKTRLSRKDASAKEELLKQIHVALILDQADRVYCVPCEAGIDISAFKKHEEEQGHKNCLLEWKRKCLHFAEKMSYKLKTDTGSGDAKAVDGSKMLYEPVRPPLDVDEFFPQDTFTLRPKAGKLDKSQQQERKEAADQTDAARRAFEEEFLKKVEKARKKQEVDQAEADLEEEAYHAKMNKCDELRAVVRKLAVLEKADFGFVRILDEPDVIYCIPCEKEVTVLEKVAHEDEEAHKAKHLEWKRQCPYCAELVSRSKAWVVLSALGKSTQERESDSEELERCKTVVEGKGTGEAAEGEPSSAGET